MLAGNLLRRSAPDLDDLPAPEPLQSWPLAGGAKFVVALGSVVGYRGTAIVNAANEGCLGGGGVDGAISEAGGEALFLAREALPELEGRPGVRCACGDAKTTVGGDLPAQFVIHAVGPNYRGFREEADPENPDEGPGDVEDELMADGLLYSAYQCAMVEARTQKMASVGFSLLSSGIFRGRRPLGAVLRIGVLAIAANAYPGLEEVAMVGFKESEIEALAAEADAVFGAAALDAPELLDGLGAKSLREMHAAALGVLKTVDGAPAAAPAAAE